MHKLKETEAENAMEDHAVWSNFFELRAARTPGFKVYSLHQAKKIQWKHNATEVNPTQQGHLSANSPSPYPNSPSD